MSRVRRVVVPVGVPLVFGCVFWWMVSSSAVVRIVPASQAQIDAAIDPSVKLSGESGSEGANPWHDLNRLFTLPLIADCPNYTPPLSGRGDAVPKARHFVDTLKWAEPRFDSLLARANKLPAQVVDEEEVDATHSKAWTYAGLKLALAQHDGDPAEIWTALRRVLMFSRMEIRIKGRMRAHFELEHFWAWRDNLRVGLADPHLTLNQLKECLRLLPTDQELLDAHRFTVRHDFNEEVIRRMSEPRISEFTRDYSKSEDWRQFYCGELDVIETVKTTSHLAAIKLKALNLPYPDSAMMVYRESRKVVPRFPNFPFAQPKDSALKRWWDRFAFRMKMRAIPNAMVRFLESGSWTAASLSNIAWTRSCIALARLHVQLRIYEEQVGRRAKTLQDLVDKGIISELPKDPFGGGNFRYDGRNLVSIGPDVRWGTPNPATVADDDLYWSLQVMPRR